jgi:cobalt-precorrin 5A hydrolase
LARNLASITGAIPVITTATDINGVAAFDLFAAENDCIIENPADLKYISSELVNGGKVALFTDYPFKHIAPNIEVVKPNASNVWKKAVIFSNRTELAVNSEKALWIRPRNLIIGLGCRKGITKEQLKTAIMHFLKQNRRSLLSVHRLATIDIKRNELGIQEVAGDLGIELRVVSSEAVKNLSGEFTYSEFVDQQIGVGGVAEQCAVLAGQNSRLIIKKTIYQGITLALAEEEIEYQL